jgi:hypothetical protein
MLEKFSMPMKIASSPSPEIEVFVDLGGVDDLAAENILSLCVETVTTTLGGAMVVQLHPVFAIGAPAPTLAPTMVLT